MPNFVTWDCWKTGGTDTCLECYEKQTAIYSDIESVNSQKSGIQETEMTTDVIRETMLTALENEVLGSEDLSAEEDAADADDNASENESVVADSTTGFSAVDPLPPITITFAPQVGICHSDIVYLENAKQKNEVIECVITNFRGQMRKEGHCSKFLVNLF